MGDDQIKSNGFGGAEGAFSPLERGEEESLGEQEETVNWREQKVMFAMNRFKVIALKLGFEKHIGSVFYFLFSVRLSRENQACTPCFTLIFLASSIVPAHIQ